MVDASRRRYVPDSPFVPAMYMHISPSVFILTAGPLKPATILVLGRLLTSGSSLVIALNVAPVSTTNSRSCLCVFRSFLCGFAPSAV